MSKPYSITKQNILDMKELLKEGFKIPYISKMFRVSQTTIRYHLTPGYREEFIKRNSFTKPYDKRRAEINRNYYLRKKAKKND